MLCYRDMAFCAATDRCGNMTCYRRWTPEERDAANLWWGSSSDGEDAPVAFADFSHRGCLTPVILDNVRPEIREEVAYALRLAEATFSSAEPVERESSRDTA